VLRAANSMSDLSPPVIMAFRFRRLISFMADSAVMPPTMTFSTLRLRPSMPARTSAFSPSAISLTRG